MNGLAQLFKKMYSICNVTKLVSYKASRKEGNKPLSKKITMQDIADQLGISKNSVSQALSGKPGVSEQTRKEVSDMAEQMGYVYKSKNLKNNHVNTIALIASDFAFSQVFFGNIYVSVQEEAKKRGINLLIESISPQAADSLAIPSFITNNAVQGIIILSHITTDYINLIMSTGVPTILIDHHHPHIEADAILTNNYFGAYKVVEHLIKKNHKKIGFIGNISFAPSYYERLQGYYMALEAYQLPIHKEFIFKEVPDDEAMVEASIDSLTELPTAWFCLNDQLGYLVNKSLKTRGYKIPEDISIFSFDNGQLAQISSPRITSMEIDLPKYGKKGVELLLWRIDNPDEPTQEISLRPTLIEGESTAWNETETINRH